MASKKVLLVEGIDDEHVIKNLCGRHDLPYLEEIKEYRGYAKLLESFPIRLKESDIQALGLVIDADTDLGARWQSIRDRIAQAGYPGVPDEPEIAGLVLEPPPSTLLPRVGVWIMPENTVPGILENFIEKLVPPGDQLFDYAETCVQAIPPALKLFRDVDLPKARIHTWLAWQNEPGKPLGQSITTRVLDANAPLAIHFVEWLKRLFFSQQA